MTCTLLGTAVRDEVEAAGAVPCEVVVEVEVEVEVRVKKYVKF